MEKLTKKNYRNVKWLSLMELADFIAEYTHDGVLEKTAWGFWKWLDRKAKPNKN